MKASVIEVWGPRIGIDGVRMLHRGYSGVIASLRDGLRPAKPPGLIKDPSCVYPAPEHDTNPAIEGTYC